MEEEIVELGLAVMLTIAMQSDEDNVGKGKSEDDKI